MYSDKDTCCFCIPLWVAVIIIGCTVIIEFLEALSLGRFIMVVFILIVGILFIVTACFKNNLIARRVLAYGYSIIFGLEFIFLVMVFSSFFMVNPADGSNKNENEFHKWCRADKEN